MIKIKFLFVILIASVVLISACGHGNRQSMEETSNNQTSHNAPPPPLPPAYDPTDSQQPIQLQQLPNLLPTGGIHPPADLGGRTLTVAGPNENLFPFTLWPSVDDEPDPATSTNYRRDRLIWDNARRVEHDFNFAIAQDIVSDMRWHPVFQLSNQSGISFADIAYAPGDVILAGVQNNWILPLCEIYLPGSDLLGAQMFSRVVAETAAGMWAFSSAEPQSWTFSLGVNMDIINATDTHNPVDLYNAGQWTWDRFMEILIATTIDTSGGRTINQWGIGGDPGQLLLQLIASNDGQLLCEDMIFTPDHPNNLEAIRLMHRIVLGEMLFGTEREHIRPTYFGGIGYSYQWWRFDDHRYLAPYSPHYIGVAAASRFMDGSSAFLTTLDWRTSPDRLPFELAIVPMPLGPSNTSGNTWMGGWRDGFILPVTSEWDAADILMIMEEFMVWPGDELNLLWDAPVYWGNSVQLSGENAIRHAENMRNMQLDFVQNVPGFSRMFRDYASWPNVRLQDQRDIIELVEAFIAGQNN